MKKLMVGGALVALATLPMVRTADLTPEEVADGVTADRATRGRAMLAALAERHGREILAAHERLDLAMVDTWHGPMGTVANPFAASSQAMDVTLDTRAWTVAFRLTDGPDRGTEWGMKDLTIYRRPPGGAIESPPVEDLDPMIGAAFLVPTLRYFLVLPVEIADAEIVAALEPVTEGDRIFDRVFATWGAADAHLEHDQYIVWIDRASGRLDRVEYTVREMMRSARGLARYGDYLDVDGALIPSRISLFAVTPGGELRLHEVQVTSAGFDES